MRMIAEMNRTELAYNVGHTCGRLNMQIKYATILAYEFKEHKIRFLEGWKDGVKEHNREMCKV